MPRKLSREQILRKERRLVRVPVTIEMLVKNILRPQDNYRYQLVSGIPSDSVFITAYLGLNEYTTFFVFAHELFEEIPEGETLPVKDVVLKEVKLNDEDDY